VLVTNTQSFLQKAVNRGVAGGDGPLEKFLFSWKKILDKVKNYFT